MIYNLQLSMEKMELLEEAVELLLETHFKIRRNLDWDERQQLNALEELQEGIRYHLYKKAGE